MLTKYPVCVNTRIDTIKDNSKLSVNTEKPLVGIVKHTDGRAELNSLVGFRPGMECEFVIDGKRLYRIPSQFITIKYEYQGDEEEYNPSWAPVSYTHLTLPTIYSV